MRRIGLVVSSLISVGLLFGAARAFGNEAKPAPSMMEPTRIVQTRAKHELLKPIFTPAKATKQGQVDDRLIRPHRTYDASGGFIG